MTDFPTRDDLFNVGANEIITRAQSRTTGRQVTQDQIFTPGSDVNLLVAGASVMGEDAVFANSRATLNLTIDGASGLALDRLVSDLTNGIVFRKQASPSRGQLQFARTSIATGAVQYGLGSIVQTQAGIRFQTLQNVSFGASSLGPISVDARAFEAGIGGNVPENTINRPITPLPDTTITITNPTFFSGGDDVESDSALRARAKSFFLAARRGVLAAIEFGALTVEDVRQASVEELLDSFGFVTRVQLHIADANGQANDQLIEAVRIVLLEFRGGGMVVDISGAIPTLVSVIFRLRYETNVDSLAAFEQVQSTTVARINNLSPNATLDRSLLFEAARSVNGVIVRDDAVVSPTGDIIPTAGQVLRTRADLVTPESS